MLASSPALQQCALPFAGGLFYIATESVQRLVFMTNFSPVRYMSRPMRLFLSLFRKAATMGPRRRKGLQPGGAGSHRDSRGTGTQQNLPQAILSAVMGGRPIDPREAPCGCMIRQKSRLLGRAEGKGNQEGESGLQRDSWRRCVRAIRSGTLRVDNCSNKT